MSGNASRIGDMSAKMAEQGAKVHVVCPPPTFPNGNFPRRWRWAKRRQDGRVTVVNLWTWQPRRANPNFVSRTLYYLVFAVHAAVWLLLRRRRFDVIVCSMPPPFTGLAAYAAGRNRVLAVDMRDRFIDAAVSLGMAKEGSVLVRASRRLEAGVLSRSRIVATTTDELARVFKERNLVPANAQIIVCPNGVDTKVFTPRPGKSEPRFVFAGNVGMAQDLECAIRAFKIVRKAKPDAKLVIAGDGDIRSSLEALAREMHLEGAVQFLGPIPRQEVPQLLASSVAGLAFLRSDSTLDYAVPTKAYEYASCGIPFLVADLAESRALAVKSEGGLVAANTPAALAKAMLWVLENPTEAKAMGMRGRAFVIEHCERSIAARRFLEAMEVAHAQTR